MAGGTALGSGSLFNYTADCGGIQATGNNAPITVAGLTNLTAYTCKVMTTSSEGPSPWSALSGSVTPQPTPPSPPTSVSAVAGDTTASVTFTPGALGSGTLVNFTVDCGGITANGPTSPITVAGLTDSTTYTCKVRTNTSIAASAWSTPSNAITPTEPPVTYFHNDISGSPMLATDAAGKVVWKENYRPYGERLTNQTGSDGNNKLWFAGKPFDAATGLTYMGARYYDPMLGRFMGVDSVGFDDANIHSFNRYAYANNNPYRFVDPDGKNPVVVGLLINAGVGAVIGAGSAALTNAAFQYLDSGTVKFGGIGGVIDAAGDGGMLGLIFGIAGGGEAGAAAGGLNASRLARDNLSADLKPSGWEAPATVTGGYNVKTGAVAARACGGGKCAEDHVVEALGGVKKDVRFSEAKRPRTGEEVPVCPRCEGKYGRDSFPNGTQFKTDQKKGAE